MSCFLLLQGLVAGPSIAAHDLLRNGGGGSADVVLSQAGGEITLNLLSPFNYAVIPARTPIRLEISGATITSVQYSVDDGPVQPLGPPYVIDTSSWSAGTQFLRVDLMDGTSIAASRVFVFFVDSSAIWPPDTVDVDVVLIGFDISQADLAARLRAAYDVTTALEEDPEILHTFSLRFDFNVLTSSDSYHQALLDYLRTKAVFRDALQGRLNLTTLIDQRDNLTRRDVFDSLAGWEIETEWAELYLEQFPPVSSSSTAGHTFYLMNLSALDDPSMGVDHWFVEEARDPDTLVGQDWWRLEWDNDLNTPMGYPLNAWGGPGHRVFVDPTAYQWYLDWTYVWWFYENGRAPYGLRYQEVSEAFRVDYLTGLVNDLVEGLSAALPWGPPLESSIEIRSYVLGGSLNYSIDDLGWVVADVALEAYLERFLPFKDWQINTTFALVQDYPDLMEVVDGNTTFQGDRGFIDGLAVWDYLFNNKELYVPDDPVVFEILTVNLLYDNRSFVYFGREFTGLGGSGITAIFLKTDRLFYSDGTRQKGLTSVISHETGHNLGYGHQFGPNFRADFVDGNMGYFRNDLEYGLFWEDALYRVYLRDRLLRLLDLLDLREPLDLAPEFLSFYRHYRALDFLTAYGDLAVIEAMLTDPVPPVAEAGPDLKVEEDRPLRLDGSASVDNFRILNYTWDFGDGTRFTSAEPTLGKTWADPGAYTVTLTVYDPAGNWDMDTLVVTVQDTTLPKISITSPPSGTLLATSEVEVIWTASDLASLAAFEAGLDGRTPVVLAATASSHTFTGLADGSHVATITAFDAAGNAKAAVITFTVDTTSPILSISLPQRGTVIAASNLQVTWSAIDATSGIDSFEVTLDGGPPLVLPATASSHTFTGVADGSHTVAVSAFDLAGNSQAVSVDLTVDTNPLSPTGPYRSGPLIGLIGTIVAGVLFVLLRLLRRGGLPPKLFRRRGSPPKGEEFLPAEEVAAQIRELGRRRDEGLITEEEFQAKKEELLSRF